MLLTRGIYDFCLIASPLVKNVHLENRNQTKWFNFERFVMCMPNELKIQYMSNFLRPFMEYVVRYFCCRVYLTGLSRCITLRLTRLGVLHDVPCTIATLCLSSLQVIVNGHGKAFRQNTQIQVYKNEKHSLIQIIPQLWLYLLSKTNEKQY